jgi:glutamate-1-semialdehyde 2,1-aminomutase
MPHPAGRTPEEDALLERAMRVLPGGVLGGYYAPQELAFIVREARGARLVDFSGREYIDYILGSGPLVLGHAHPAVVAAVEEQLKKGTTYFQLSEPTLALAEEICRAVPCAEQVRFCSTGTEATFFALRLCRAFRRKDKILKFEGGFHGTHDYSLMSVGPRAPKAFPAPTPDSAGIPHAIQDEVLIAPFNDLSETEAMIEAHHQDLAAVIMEPFQRLITPQPGFLEGVRAVTARPRRPPRVRRDRHRLPLRLWRRAGILRRGARRRRPRQGGGRRVPPLRGRGPAGHHAAPRA